MYDATKDGNIELFDDLLDIPGADINMEWVSSTFHVQILINIKAGNKFLSDQPKIIWRIHPHSSLDHYRDSICGR